MLKFHHSRSNVLNFNIQQENILFQHFINRHVLMKEKSLKTCIKIEFIVTIFVQLGENSEKKLLVFYIKSEIFMNREKKS